MNSLVNIEVIGSQNVPSTTSLKIAEVFGKEHFHVIRDIENLIDTGELNQSNFGCVNYKDKKGEYRKMYILDETFTTVLLMGFTGKEAVKWQVAYAKEFQNMREEIQNKPAKRAFLTVGDTFKDFLSVAEALGLKKEQSAIHANHATKKKTGDDVLALMELKFTVDEPTASITVHLGKSGLNITPVKANKILLDKGYLAGRPGDYSLTEKGKTIGKLVSQEAHGKMRTSIEWNSDVIKVLSEQ